MLRLDFISAACYLSKPPSLIRGIETPVLDEFDTIFLTAPGHIQTFPAMHRTDLVIVAPSREPPFLVRCIGAIELNNLRIIIAAATRHIQAFITMYGPDFVYAIAYGCGRINNSFYKTPDGIPMLPAIYIERGGQFTPITYFLPLLVINRGPPESPL